MPSEINEPSHPTREKLISETLLMLDELPLEDVHAGEVLRRTGISKGSLYHHFDDFSELLEAAYLRRFIVTVEASNDAIASIVAASSDAEDFYDRLREVTFFSQQRSRAPFRFERARMVAKAERNDRFMKTLGEIQQRQTDAFTVSIELAQEKGWVSRDFQARTLAVFIQAYTLGRVLDDITTVKMDDEDWNHLIDSIVRKTIAP